MTTKPRDAVTAKVQVAQQQIREAVTKATSVTSDAIVRWMKKIESAEEERNKPRRVSGLHPVARGR